MKTIMLNDGKRYTHKGRLYLADRKYVVTNSVADDLLAKLSTSNQPLFVEVTGKRSTVIPNTTATEKVTATTNTKTARAKGNKVVSKTTKVAETTATEAAAAPAEDTSDATATAETAAVGDTADETATADATEAETTEAEAAK